MLYLFCLHDSSRLHNVNGMSVNCLGFGVVLELSTTILVTEVAGGVPGI